MKKKSLLLTALATLGLTAATLAQNVPNYVPTNGLIGWWPFSGNANDESGNGNNGTVNGATLTVDRYNNISTAFSFNGNSNIQIQNSTSLQVYSQLSISIWFKYTTLNNGINYLLQKGTGYGCLNTGYHIAYDNDQGQAAFNKFISYGQNGNCAGIGDNSYLDSSWHNIIVVYHPPSNNKIYFDGLEVGNTSFCNSCTILNSNDILTIGGPTNGLGFNLAYNWNGKIDDIGIWNRALTQQEITDLYNGANCANNTTITPSTNTLNTGSTAIFSASTSDSNPSYLWQSDFGQGYVTLNNFGNYSGTNTATLNLSNVQLSNHNLPIRVITTSGNCIDTSNVAVISIADTCINTITDTTLITVTDTLLINTNLTGVNPPNNVNTIKIFPNPANDHITINYGNFTVMNGYQLKIENAIGQQVFQTNITQQSDYLNLTTWGGNGLYFVHIINPQGYTIDIRKIVLQ